ncbi:MAG: hypothetical protein US96_C0039G0015 [Candidatus Woesebacteria bacterium GW2011_GWB1_38_5b]|uniref:CYTH domain-containing protein n=1 Tax=Candidatus Woesebacteria bacterium GW2011_GWB1_38_5b TaxID=1618569 RepID=A0A0G0MKF4_9BACT|nr:MAG: hypothetical protein US96_C0039G0015 [Candidatus Woesebacteria bacterium GW2011_GWB1_38_5b]
MTEEKELLTILTKNEYDKVLVSLTKEFGVPEIVKRLSLQATDYRSADVDTRLRITNGKAEIIQKLGDWKKGNRHELSVPLPPDPQMIFNIYKIFLNAMKDSEVQSPIMQLENRLLRTKDFEIKLTYQFGKASAYNCEIEVFDHSLEPTDLAKKYAIPIHLPTQTQDFWKKWNEKVNLSAGELADEKLQEIITKYL